MLKNLSPLQKFPIFHWNQSTICIVRLISVGNVSIFLEQLGVFMSLPEMSPFTYITDPENCQVSIHQQQGHLRGYMEN